MASRPFTPPPECFTPPQESLLSRPSNPHSQEGPQVFFLFFFSEARVPVGANAGGPVSVRKTQLVKVLDARK